MTMKEKVLWASIAALGAILPIFAQSPIPQQTIGDGRFQLLLAPAGLGAPIGSDGPQRPILFRIDTTTGHTSMLEWVYSTGHAPALAWNSVFENFAAVYRQFPPKDGVQEIGNAPPESSIASEPAFQRPTATEVFDLRSKCVGLSEKMSKDNDLTLRYLTELTKEPALPLLQEHFSHYNPKTNRCFVELRITFDLAALKMVPKVSDTFLAKFDLDYIQRHLYDGQTGEELAYAQKGLKAVAPFGLISGIKVTWSEAFEGIDELMADNRRQ
jgi:hypothetical protein